jgi:hypothetical protein
VTDEAGKQLQVMHGLGRPLICAVKKIHADAGFHMGEGEAEAWGARLEEEAKRYKPSS